MTRMPRSRHDLRKTVNLAAPFRDGCRRCGRGSHDLPSDIRLDNPYDYIVVIMIGTRSAVIKNAFPGRVLGGIDWGVIPLIPRSFPGVPVFRGGQGAPRPNVQKWRRKLFVSRLRLAFRAYQRSRHTTGGSARLAADKLATGVMGVVAGRGGRSKPHRTQ